MAHSGIRLVIIGGVAGGASAAARARRLSEDAAITIIERGPDVSFANCGMPYFIGGEITDREKLNVHTPDSLKNMLAVEIRSRTEALSVDRRRKVVVVRNASGGTEEVPYDKLILSPGAAPLRPPLPGIDDSRIMTLRDLRDMDRIKERMATAKKVTVIGAGFIGLEMAEMLVRLKKEVALVEAVDQVLPQVDHEMAKPIEDELKRAGVDLTLADPVAAFEANALCVSAGGITTILKSGKKIQSDLVILSIGVKCESQLAAAAGLELGIRGSIKVNAFMQSSDPDVYAVGDAVETEDPIFGRRTVVPLAGPANRQGRTAADHIFLGNDAVPYPGTIGTAIVRAFDVIAAVTGYTEKRLILEKIEYRSTTVTAPQHASYYPGAVPLVLKVLWDPGTGRVLGGQAVGCDGVDKRIDVIATAIAGRLTIDQLAHLELAYAPPFGSARDIVNIAGFSAQNIQKGLVHPQSHFPSGGDLQVLDVRAAEPARLDPIPSAISIPFEELRKRMDELDKSRPVVTVCGLGKMSYFAARLLRQKGFNVKSLVGGWSMVPHASRPHALCNARHAPHVGMPEGVLEIDACGLSCPGPIMKISEVLSQLGPGQILRVHASDPGFAHDFPAFCKSCGLSLVKLEKEKGIFTAEAHLSLEPSQPGTSQGGATLVVFSADLDKVLAAFVIANGAAAMGGPVTMFFTFWGLNAIRRPDPMKDHEKPLIDRMFGEMMPRGIEKLGLSRMHFAGLGTRMMTSRMAKKNLPTLPLMLESARKAGVRLVACSMSMEAMGIQEEELIDGVEIGGVADFLAASRNTGTNLFI